MNYEFNEFPLRRCGVNVLSLLQQIVVCSLSFLSFLVLLLRLILLRVYQSLEKCKHVTPGTQQISRAGHSNGHLCTLFTAMR